MENAAGRLIVPTSSVMLGPTSSTLSLYLSLSFSLSYMHSYRHLHTYEPAHKCFPAYNTWLYDERYSITFLVLYPKPLFGSNAGFNLRVTKQVAIQTVELEHLAILFPGSHLFVLPCLLPQALVFHLVQQRHLVSVKMSSSLYNKPTRSV